MQNEIIDDVVSDDDMARVNKKDIIQESAMFNKIKMGIDMLLDSDDDYNQN